MVAPAIIVGGGRVGRALQDLGNGDDVLVKRGEPVPIDFVGPILVCTRNDDLEAVLEATPKSRWSGMLEFPSITLCYLLFRVKKNDFFFLNYCIFKTTTFKNMNLVGILSGLSKIVGGWVWLELITV